jgi:hypothetical protein
VLAFCRAGTDNAACPPAEKQQHSHEHAMECSFEISLVVLGAIGRR